MNKIISPAIVSFSGHSLTEDEKRLFSKYNPIGFNLFARNIKDKTQLKKLIKDIKELLERDDIIFAVDQEGGRVRRLSEPEFRPYVPQYIFGDMYNNVGKEKAKEIAQYHSFLISSDLKEVGFNMNYAPVLDMAQEYTSPALKSRCFSSNRDSIAELGSSMVMEYIKNGICPCIKHMPGHGRASTDPHLNLPIITTPLKDLESDFYPFIINKSSPAGMTAHIVIPEIDDKLPVTQSKKAIDTLIRGKLGFEGLLISDAIDMKALNGNIGEKTKSSIEAGCDVICYAFGKYEELIEIFNNCSNMSDKSLLRFEKIREIIKQCPKFHDVEKIANIYKEETGNIETYSDNYDATEVLNKMIKK